VPLLPRIHLSFSVSLFEVLGDLVGAGLPWIFLIKHTNIYSVGSGEHLTDLERFEPKPFISKLLGYGDMGSLIEHIQSITKDSAGMKETQKHLQEGIFTIRDMKEQITNIMKMGPLSKVAGMIPGMSGMVSLLFDFPRRRTNRLTLHVTDARHVGRGWHRQTKTNDIHIR
jgi:hypothetical protein